MCGASDSRYPRRRPTESGKTNAVETGREKSARLPIRSSETLAAGSRRFTHGRSPPPCPGRAARVTGGRYVTVGTHAAFLAPGARDPRDGAAVSFFYRRLTGPVLANFPLARPPQMAPFPVALKDLFPASSILFFRVTEIGGRVKAKLRRFAVFLSRPVSQHARADELAID